MKLTVGLLSLTMPLGLALAGGTAAVAATISGTPGDDLLLGTPRADSIRGLDGDDTLRGLRGADELFGNHGQDFLYWGRGRDVLGGGAGPDLLVGGPGDDRLYGEQAFRHSWANPATTTSRSREGPCSWDMARMSSTLMAGISGCAFGLGTRTTGTTCKPRTPSDAQEPSPDFLVRLRRGVLLLPLVHVLKPRGSSGSVLLGQYQPLRGNRRPRPADPLGATAHVIARRRPRPAPEAPVHSPRWVGGSLLVGSPA